MELQTAFWLSAIFLLLSTSAAMLVVAYKLWRAIK